MTSRLYLAQTSDESIMPRPDRTERVIQADIGTCGGIRFCFGNLNCKHGSPTMAAGSAWMKLYVDR
jgi:hypothetical protein